MNVIFHAADDQWLAIKICKNAAEVAMQFFAQGFVSQKWAAIFRRENGVHNDFGE